MAKKELIMKAKVKALLNKGVDNTVDNFGTGTAYFVAGSAFGTAWLPQIIQWGLGLVGAG